MVSIMKIENVIKKSCSFKEAFEHEIIPYINRKINEGESKVTISEDYINELLKFHYNTDNLYIKIRNIISESQTNLGVSIKRKNKEFIFYKKTEEINRESDLFKVIFEQKFKPQLLKNLKDTYIIGFEENFLKKILNVNYNINTMHIKLKNALLETNLKVFIKKDILVNGKKTNEFIFYDIDKRKIYKDNKSKEIDKDKEDWNNYLIESEKKVKEEDKIMHNEALKELTESLKEFDKTMKDLFDKHNNNENNDIICPYCNNEIKYPELICSSCKSKVLKKWE